MTMAMRAFVITVLMVACLCGSAASGQIHDDAFPFTVSIHLDKEQYLLDEPIWVDYFIVNTAQAVATANATEPYLSSFRLVLTDEKGDTIPESSKFIVDLDPVPRTMDVLPGDTLYVMSNLLEGYGDPPPWFSVINTLGQGTYILQAVQQNRNMSNTVSFTVVEPTGFEIEAHDLLMQAFERNFRASSDRDAGEYHALVENYPRSVYAPRAYSRMSAIYRYALPDPDKVLEIKTKILKEYPASGYVDDALGVYIAHHGESARPFIDSLKTASGSIRFRMLAKQYGF